VENTPKTGGLPTKKGDLSGMIDTQAHMRVNTWNKIQ